MARRANHSGSVFQGADGYWVATLRSGDRKRVTRYGRSRAEVVRKLHEI